MSQSMILFSSTPNHHTPPQRDPHTHRLHGQLLCRRVRASPCRGGRVLMALLPRLKPSLRRAPLPPEPTYIPRRPHMPRACAPGRRDGKAPPHSAIFLRIYARTVSCHPPAAACRKVSAYTPPRTRGMSTAAQRQRVSGFCPSPRAYAPCEKGKTPPAPAPLHLSFTGQSLSSVRPRI